MQGAPIFGKIELLIKDKGGINKEEYYDSGMVITGNYIIIVVNERDDVETTNSSTGIIYKMEDIKSYRTHAK
tara:strand:+ start:580 stop:795 length:216 start_codon:yes stop_codon:yes gene_type:complete